MHCCSLNVKPIFSFKLKVLVTLIWYVPTHFFYFRCTCLASEEKIIERIFLCKMSTIVFFFVKKMSTIGSTQKVEKAWVLYHMRCEVSNGRGKGDLKSHLKQKKNVEVIFFFLATIFVPSNWKKWGCSDFEFSRKKFWNILLTYFLNILFISHIDRYNLIFNKKFKNCNAKGGS